MVVDNFFSPIGTLFTINLGSVIEFCIYIYNSNFIFIFIKSQSFLFSLKWISINVIIIICKINHSLPMKVFKIHRNILCIYHYLISVKILNSPQYIMYPPPPHMLYMHPSSNVEPPTSGSSQNP